jgi:phosphatidylserine/phosphatidylglycerophosphate/cardiolipin synthase-like enzyme
MFMAKKSSNQRSLLGTLLAVVVIIIAAVVSFLGGGDLTQNDVDNIENVLNTVIPPATEVADVSLDPTTLVLQQGFGAQDRFWQVYFTAPTGSRNGADYVGGVDNPLAEAILASRGTIDIAAFEFNNVVITQAILNAHQRGVRVRMVTDNEFGMEDEDSTVPRLISAGIPVVDDGRSALMHNKFIIIDSTTVWTGSLNYTVNGVYRNNNNLLGLRSRRTVDGYQAEFDEMFVNHEFGARSTGGNGVNFNQDGVPVRVMFAPEDNVVPVLVDTLAGANTSIRFMAFSFTLDELGDVIQRKASDGVDVQGIFETSGSLTRFSEMTPLFCIGLPVRQDGNPFVLHHKVFIVDDETVITGSFNFSSNATNSNDENMIIIQDRSLAQQYVQEFDRRWAEATAPQGLQ